MLFIKITLFKGLSFRHLAFVSMVNDEYQTADVLLLSLRHVMVKVDQTFNYETRADVYHDPLSTIKLCF